MSGQTWWCVTGLLCMLLISVSSGTVYVQSGSDITGCNVKCHHADISLELYRECGGKERPLIELYCRYSFSNIHDSRLKLDKGSGCWKLTYARKDDSCVYKIWFSSTPEHTLYTTDIRVLDPILISNITSNFSRLGEKMAVSVQFSGEESAVTWEVDGEPLPERYRLIDGNRTLIIPSVQRDDAERRFRVRITNPVSEEFGEYRLINDTMFIKRLETEDFISNRRWSFIAGLGVTVILVVVMVVIIFPIHSRRKRNSEIMIPNVTKDEPAMPCKVEMSSSQTIAPLLTTNV